MTRPLRCPPRGCVDLWLLAGSTRLEAVHLDRDEEARAARMATQDLQRRVRRRRTFLRSVLARYLDLRPEAVPLRVASGGKPMLEPGAELHFNISHTHEISVLAIGADPVGIDVEKRKPFERLADLTAYACSARERATIAAAPDAEAAFLDRWVIKEAVLKCRGSGLVDNLRDIDPGPVSGVPIRWKELALQRPPPPSGNAGLHLALAVSGPLAGLVWRGVEPDD